MKVLLTAAILWTIMVFGMKKIHPLPTEQEGKLEGKVTQELSSQDLTNITETVKAQYGISDEEVTIDTTYKVSGVLDGKIPKDVPEEVVLEAIKCTRCFICCSRKKKQKLELEKQRLKLELEEQRLKLMKGISTWKDIKGGAPWKLSLKAIDDSVQKDAIRKFAMTCLWKQKKLSQHRKKLFENLGYRYDKNQKIGIFGYYWFRFTTSYYQLFAKNDLRWIMFLEMLVRMWRCVINGATNLFIYVLLFWSQYKEECSFQNLKIPCWEYFQHYFLNHPTNKIIRDQNISANDKLMMFFNENKENFEIDLSSNFYHFDFGKGCPCSVCDEEYEEIPIPQNFNLQNNYIHLDVKEKLSSEECHQLKNKLNFIIVFGLRQSCYRNNQMWDNIYNLLEEKGKVMFEYNDDPYVQREADANKTAPFVLFEFIETYFEREVDLQTELIIYSKKQ